MQKIVDFRDSGHYKHIRLTEPNTLSDEQLLLATMHRYRSNQHISFLRDSHVFTSTPTADEETTIEIPTASASSLYDGVYDIWLRDCHEVKKVKVKFNDVEVELDVKDLKTLNNGDIQIPLAFKEGTR